MTDSGTGAPLAGIEVRVYSASGSYVGNAWTNASGGYTTAGLAPGTYYLRTSNSLGYVDEAHNNVACPGSSCYPYTTGTGVSVTAGATTGGIDFGLAAGGTITGTVTDSGTGAPLASVYLNIYNASGNYVSYAYPNASGAYTSPGLPTGTYYVQTSNGLGYVDERYDDLPCPGGSCTGTTGTGVSVAAGATTSRIDFALAVGGAIAGTLTDAGTGAPLAGVYLSIYNASGNYVGWARTDALGAYTSTSLPTGTYYVRTSNSFGYLDELYDNLPCAVGSCTATTGTGVSVAAGATTSRIDFALALGGAIAGTVTDAGTGAPLANVTVYVYNASNSSQGSVTTDASGVYTKGGFATGTYYVRTSNSLGYLDELYNNLPCVGGSCSPYTTGTGVGVTAGATTRGIDFGLTLGGTITGTVTDAGTGAPLANVSVRVYNASGSSVGSSVTTNASGIYTKTGLLAGTYYLTTSNSLGYVDELYNNLPCAGGSCTVTTGTGVSVTLGATAGGIDIGLVLGGTITGTVTDAGTGAPLANVSVRVYNASGSSVGSSVTTNASGIYTKTGLLAGTHYLRTSNSLGYIDELYNNLPCPGGSCTVTTGTGVSVTAGATAGGIDIGLVLGGTITGTVTDAGTGAPLAGVSLSFYTASGSSVGSSVTTNASGIYTKTGLAAGTYYLTTSNSLGYIDELYNNLPCAGSSCFPYTTGTGVTVTAGMTTGNINFGLTVGGTITGTVTDAGTGAPLANVSVRVYNASGSSVGGSVTTNASGIYTKTGLAAGTYYLTTSNSLGYIDELYNNLPCARGNCYPYTSGTGVSVTAGGAAGGINFGLAAGGTISGTVTDAGTGAPLAGVSLYVYGSTGYFASVTTNASGTYVATGLTTGTYYVYTTNSLGYVDELYNNLPLANYQFPSYIAGTGISVTAGTATSGINFGLAAGGSISGTVTAAETGLPLANVYVNVYDARGRSVANGTTNDAGLYTVRTGLATGTYYVRTWYSPEYLDELYDNLACGVQNCTVTTGMGVAVTAGSTTGGINFSLAAAGTITGTVTDAATAAPLANVQVYVFNAIGDSVGSFTTNASGAYAAKGLATGTYYVQTRNSAGYVDEAYNDVPCSDYECAVAKGAGIHVTAGAATTGIDFGLAVGGTITGTVTVAGTGAPLSGVYVDIHNAAGQGAGYGQTNASGAYTTTGLATGTYYVRTSNPFGYVDLLYDSLACTGCAVTSGTGVSVTAGTTTTGINFGLGPGGTITGSVTDASTGAPLEGIYVSVCVGDEDCPRSGETDASGMYAIRGLATGAYRVVASTSRGYISQIYGGPPCNGEWCPPLTSGTGVGVTVGATTSGIDFSLVQGGAISGTVTEAGTNAPLPNVSVRVYDASGNFLGESTWGAAGPYTIAGLQAGIYYARTLNESGYVDEAYDNLLCVGSVCPAASGNGVSVAAGATTPGIDFVLDFGGSIAGTVTDAGTGAPLGAIVVDVYDATGGAVGAVKTNASGVYVKTGLGTGTCYVRTSNSHGYVDELYSDLPCAGGSCALTSGTGVSVTAGVTTSGINFGLAVPPVPPAITWANPGAIVYGTALSATQLNATANVAGTFVYTPAPGTVLNAGTGQVLSVIFTPTDTLNYTTATKTVTIDVTQAMPVVTWANPAAITTGTALGPMQLNATANVAGTFVYTPPAGTVLSLGAGQTLSVTFTPTDAANYTTATKAVVIDVLSLGSPVITDVAPGGGAIGSGVTVMGTGFTGATAVTFHGVPAGYAVVSDTQLTTTVPAGTTTGRVRVTTPIGTGTSATDFVVTNQRATRTLPGCYVAGYGVTVSIDVGPAPAVLQQALADTPPAGWTVGTISDSGVWDAPTSQVNWGPFFDATARVLTYVVTPPAETTGAVTFAGVARFDGVEVALGGTTTLSRCEQHPADANSDFRMVIGEVTGYGAAWKKGNTWAVPPVPIPIGYVTRAGYLWRVGETYRRDAGACPVCWMPLTAVPLPVPDGFLSLEDIPTPHRGPWSPGSSLRLFDELRVAPSGVEGRLRSGQADPGATAVRQAPATYVPTVPLSVTLTVTPDGDVQSWALEETVPAGWQVSAVSADGYRDEKAGVVRWGPFFDEAPQTLRYTLTPPAGASEPQTLRGTASFDGVDVAVTGARTLQRAPITRPGDPGSPAGGDSGPGGRRDASRVFAARR